MADPLAIYGAVIGTTAALGVAWDIYDRSIRHRDRVRLRIGREQFAKEGETGYALVSFDPASLPREERGRVGQGKAHLQVVNDGSRPIRITEAGLELTNGQYAVFQPGTGGELQQGCYLSFRISEEGLRQGLELGRAMPKRIYAKDSKGRVWRQPLDRKLGPWFESLMLSSPDGDIEESIASKE